jgi:UDP-glucose 4-epimerase
MTSTPWQKRPVLITGGASFIGSHLADALVERGARVTVVDDLSSGRREHLQSHLETGAIEFVHGRSTTESPS